MLLKWIQNKKHQLIDRPCWDEFFLQIVDDVATRSSDAQFHAGAIIVSPDHHILSTGYNGFVCGIEDEFLPNTRPEKYPFMLHAELNAILSCEHRPHGAIIYTNTHPCLHCFQACVQAGISEVVFNTMKKATMIDQDMDAKLEIVKWLARDKIKVRGYDYKGKGQ